MKSVLVHKPWRFIVDDDWNVYLSFAFGIEIGWKLIAINGITIHETNAAKMYKKYEAQLHFTHLTFETHVINKINILFASP